MSDPQLLGPPRVRHRLAQLAGRPLNFDPAALERASPTDGWVITELCQELPAEPPGPPADQGSWQIARRLMSGYEFADPSIVRAYYDPDEPLEGRNMLLKLQAFGLLRIYVGVRVAEVYDRTLTRDGQEVRVWGWSYQTLQGHVEMGQMDWEVWKWLGDGRIEFRVHAISRSAPIRNPIIRLGFHLLRGRERRAFLDSTTRRMLSFTELALEAEDPGASIRATAADATARPGGADADPAHAELARRIAQH